MREPTNILAAGTLIIYEVLDLGGADLDIIWSTFSRAYSLDRKSDEKIIFCDTIW